MPRIKKDEFVKPIIQERVFTDAELEKFHRELQDFKVTVIIKGNEEVSYIYSHAYHIFRKTMSDQNTIIIDTDTFGDVITPTRYERLENKFKQYKSWLMKKEYIRKIEQKELEKIAESIGNTTDLIF